MQAGELVLINLFGLLVTILVYNYFTFKGDDPIPEYKLTYFNCNALSEPIRWAFKVSEVPFEDERIEEKDWPALKESGRFPGKQMPLLEIDGQVYTQSAAILRHLGHKFGLTADDDLSNLRVDQVHEIVTDGRIPFIRFLLENDPLKKAEMRKELVNNVLPVVLKQLNDILSFTDGDFIVGSKLTWGDLSLANWLQIWEKHMDQKLLEPYEALVKQKNAVLSIPQIQAWIAERPDVEV